MNNIFKIGAIGLGTFFGFKYFNAISKAKNLKFAFSKITINAINSNAFQIGIWLKVSSTNNGNLTLSKSRLKAYLNGTLCGVAVLPYNQIINGQHTTDIYLVCDLYYKDTFKEWWNLLLKSSTTATLTIAGGLVVAGTYIPIPALNVKEFSLKDTIQEIKSSNVGALITHINLYSVDNPFRIAKEIVEKGFYTTRGTRFEKSTKRKVADNATIYYDYATYNLHDFLQKFYYNDDVPILYKKWYDYNVKR